VIEIFGNLEEYGKAGLNVDSRLNSIVPGGFDQWLDPTSEAFGPSSKWYKHDPAEAKKLMRAAGYSTALETTFSHTDLKKGGSVYTRKQEVIAQMWQESGDFKLTINTPDYDSIYRQTYHYGRDKVEGVFVGQSPGSMPEVDGWFTGFVHSNNDQTGHLDAPGKPPADIDALIDKQRTELDPNKRKELIYDIQKKFAEKMYIFIEAGSSQSFSLAWPWVGNWGLNQTFEGGVPAVETIPHLWLDNSKKTT
jgi:ABC-type transport system substrate-binding protein